jgi:hypothetical protein
MHAALWLRFTHPRFHHCFSLLPPLWRCNKPTNTATIAINYSKEVQYSTSLLLHWYRNKLADTPEVTAEPSVPIVIRDLVVHRLGVSDEVQRHARRTGSVLGRGDRRHSRLLA